MIYVCRYNDHNAYAMKISNRDTERTEENVFKIFMRYAYKLGTYIFMVYKYTPRCNIIFLPCVLILRPYIFQPLNQYNTCNRLNQDIF